MWEAMCWCWRQQLGIFQSALDSLSTSETEIHSICTWNRRNLSGRGRVGCSIWPIWGWLGEGKLRLLTELFLESPWKLSSSLISERVLLRIFIPALSFLKFQRFLAAALIFLLSSFPKEIGMASYCLTVSQPASKVSQIRIIRIMPLYLN